MDKLFKFRVTVTTPYLQPNKHQIQQDFEETLKLAIEQIIKDNLDSLGIVGIGVIVNTSH